ncbi:MAG: hypothetical protein IJ084_05770 [Prevotella sp.]|nr:hypothetical protein [Prevotella sp.]
MGFYKDSLERLHNEYTNRTSITLFGRQATLLRLLVDVYEVSLRFEKLLGVIKQGPTMMEDSDVDYLEWSDPKKWVKPEKSEYFSKSRVRDTYGIMPDEQFEDIFSNKMLNVFGDRVNNIEADRYKSIIRSVISSQYVISDAEFEFAIDNNLKKLQDTLLQIYNFKENVEWKDYDYSFMYKNLYEFYVKSEWHDKEAKRCHKRWVKDMIEPKEEDYQERRRELLIELFNSGFLDKLRDKIKTIPTDDFCFCEISDDELIPDLNDTLKYYAAFKKLCPIENGKISFDNHALLGRYIHDSNIPMEKILIFFHYMALLKIVQNELEWMEHPESRPTDEDEVIDAFIDVVKKIMLKAQDNNGQVIKDKDNRHNEIQFEYQIDGSFFCSVMDILLTDNKYMIADYLGGRNKKNALGVSCVAPFIGAILRTNIFSCREIRYKDVEFAFRFVLGEKNEEGKKISYIQKMGIKQNIDNKSIFSAIKSIASEQKKL